MRDTLDGMLALMSDQPAARTGVHPAAIVGASLAAIALFLASVGYAWAWVPGIAAVIASAAARPPGAWTRVLGLVGIIGGIVAVGLAFT